MQVDVSKVDRIIDHYKEGPRFLIAMLQDIQHTYRYLPKEALKRINERTGVPFSKIYSVATFYKAFSLVPRGKYEINVCLGTACHLRGGERIVEAFTRELNIKVGNTTKDLKFSLGTVNCLGACALAPLVKINEDNHGKVAASKVEKIIKQYE